MPEFRARRIWRGVPNRWVSRIWNRKFIPMVWIFGTGSLGHSNNPNIQRPRAPKTHSFTFDEYVEPVPAAKPDPKIDGCPKPGVSQTWSIARARCPNTSLGDPPDRVGFLGPCRPLRARCERVAIPVNDWESRTVIATSPPWFHRLRHSPFRGFESAHTARLFPRPLHRPNPEYGPH